MVERPRIRFGGKEYRIDAERLANDPFMPCERRWFSIAREVTIVRGYRRCRP